MPVCRNGSDPRKDKYLKIGVTTFLVKEKRKIAKHISWWLYTEIEHKKRGLIDDLTKSLN